MTEILTSHRTAIQKLARSAAVFSNGAMVDARMVMAVGRMIAGALLAFAADIERKKDAIANMQTFIFDTRANCADDTCALMTEDSRKLHKRQEALLKDDVLVMTDLRLTWSEGLECFRIFIPCGRYRNTSSPPVLHPVALRPT